MKKLFASITALILLTSLYAADPAFHGTFLDAMQETDDRTRVVKLIDAIEISANSGPVDTNAIKMLKLEMDNNNPALAELLPRLITLLDKNPNDFALAGFCFHAAAKYNQLSPENFAVFEKSLSSVDIAKLSADDLTGVTAIFKSYAESFIFNEQYDRCTALLDAFSSKCPGNPAILQMQAELISRICFMLHNTAPGLNGYDELSADDPWKNRLNTLGTQLLNLPISSAEDAEIQLLSAAALHLTQTPELLRQYAGKYPAHDWTIISAAIAAAFRQPELLITGNINLINFVAALHAGNFAKAETFIAEMPEAIRLVFNIILDSARGNHQQVTRAISSGQVELEDLSLFAMQFVINSAFIQKDTTLIRDILNIIWQNKDDIATENPGLCNSIGYIAAVFNIELDKAEALIRIAVQSAPRNPSYLDSLAWVLFRQGKIEDAENTIMTALKYREPAAAICVLYLHAAEIKVAANKHAEAKTMLNKAKQLYDPDDEACSEYNLQTEKRLERLLK